MEVFCVSWVEWNETLYGQHGNLLMPCNVIREGIYIPRIPLRFIRATHSN